MVIIWCFLFLVDRYQRFKTLWNHAENGSLDLHESFKQFIFPPDKLELKVTVECVDTMDITIKENSCRMKMFNR